MSVPEFAPGTACGGALTSSQVSARQVACTEMAIAGMQNPHIYRQWKEAATEQQRTALASSSFYWKVAKWLFLTAMIAGVIAPIREAASAHSSTIATSCRSAAEALFPLVPHSQAYSNEDAVNMPTNTVPDQPFTNNLFPEIKQEVAAMEGSAQPQQAHHNDGNHSTLLLGSVLDSRGGSRTNWALEDSLLRAAELESDLASRHEEHQQLSAHLLQAARQLAAVGQPVQLPEAQQTSRVQEWDPINTALIGTLLLILTWTLWRLLVSTNRDPITAEQLAPYAGNAAEEATSLQQHNSKLERQLEQQQQQLRHAEQSIMGLTSSKAQVEVQLRGSQQKVSGLLSDLARAECLLDSHAVAKMKLPLFPMSPLAAPPVRHDKDKENCGRTAAKSKMLQVATPAFAKAPSEKDVLLDRLRDMEAEKCRLEVKVASLEADQADLKEVCRQADVQRTNMQLDAEALELRVFTTHEQLAVSEEKEAELAAQVQQAQQLAAAAQQPLATPAQAAQAMEDSAQAAQGSLPSCTAHLEQQDQHRNECQAEQRVMPAAKQAGLQRGQAPAEEHPKAAAASPATGDSQPSSTSQTPTADADRCMATSAVAAQDTATTAFGCDRSMPGATTAVGDTPTAAGCGTPTTLQPIRTRRASSSDVSKRESLPVSVSGVDPGHLAAGPSGLQASGRANSLYSSPIFGVASSSSQAFSPARDHTAQMPRQGPKTPWSADWVTAFFSPGKTSVSRRRPGSISPTRLFDFNGDNNLPEPEDLFKMAWQGQPK